MDVTVLVPIAGSLQNGVAGREPQVVLREEWWVSAKNNGAYPPRSPDITHEAQINMLVARSMEIGTEFVAELMGTQPLGDLNCLHADSVAVGGVAAGGQSVSVGLATGCVPVRRVALLCKRAQMPRRRTRRRARGGRHALGRGC